ncbi:MAG TPA: hypothetical protein PKD09_09240 [Aggregatilinea sp.]|uniref:hypothetical protein n=1 Tax=Aggregatilinea sp. TaxID=2806333 RepID=UPI002B7B3459|nr:hypothetical protein [Aggregatilinea sp.]HML21820.1 hypothetical protein [Aggregatilinea sp.]
MGSRSQTELKTGLQRRLGNIFRMRDEEINALADSLYKQRVQAWKTAIAENAKACGYTGAIPEPSGRDAQWLKSMSRLDADSIAKTWRKDVEKEIGRLYEANHRGNRYYYRKGIDEWNAKREVWKSRQIANQTEMTTFGFAQARFLGENEGLVALYTFVGPPPVCVICIRLYGMGAVTKQVMQEYPTPIHFGCTHTWRIMPGTATGIDPGKLWVGGKTPRKRAA